MAPETYSSSSSSRLCFFLQRTETLLKQTKINWEIHWACFRHPRIHSPFPQKSRPSHEYQLSPSLPPGIGYTDHKVAQVGWSRHKQKLKSQLLTLSREWEINLGGGRRREKPIWGRHCAKHFTSTISPAGPISVPLCGWETERPRGTEKLAPAAAPRGRPGSGRPGFQSRPIWASSAKSPHFSEAQTGRSPTGTPGLCGPGRLTVNVSGISFSSAICGLRSPPRRVVRRINEPELRARPPRARRAPHRPRAALPAGLLGAARGPGRGASSAPSAPGGKARPGKAGGGCRKSGPPLRGRPLKGRPSAAMAGETRRLRPRPRPPASPGPAAAATATAERHPPLSPLSTPRHAF